MTAHEAHHVAKDLGNQREINRKRCTSIACIGIGFGHTETTGMHCGNQEDEHDDNK